MKWTTSFTGLWPNNQILNHIYLSETQGITRGSNPCQYCSTPHRGAAEGAESWLRKSLCVKAAGGAGSRYKAPPLPPPRSHSSGTRSTPVAAFTHKNPQPDAPGTYHSQTHRWRSAPRSRYVGTTTKTTHFKRDPHVGFIFVHVNTVRRVMECVGVRKYQFKLWL